MDKQWLSIINYLTANPGDLHTVPKKIKQPLWFYADTDGSYIYISNAKNHSPSSKISGVRKLTYVEFERIYPIYLRREKGEAVSIEASKATVNQVYWYSIFRSCCLVDNMESESIQKNTYNNSNIEVIQLQDNKSTATNTISCSLNTKNVLGYEFNFVQYLVPECDINGSLKKYFPQKYYKNIDNLPLSRYGDGCFCSFSINYSSTSGVYLWVVDEEIIYIGETNNLNRRFNQGYGTINPRNCYIGGQNTNCKMNKVVLELYEQGKIIKLYFYQTHDYKQIELVLLRAIKTEFNIKDN